MKSKDRNSSPQNATLSPSQENALAALLAGSTVSDAGDAAGVDRTTVHRWMREDDDFRAELNCRRNELRAVQQDRLTRLCDKAVTCVESALDSGDARTALALLKGLAILDAPKIGPESADELRLERSEARQSQFLRGVGLRMRQDEPEDETTTPR